MTRGQIFVTELWRENRLLICLVLLAALCCLSLTVHLRLVVEPQVRLLMAEEQRLQQQVVLLQRQQTENAIPLSQAQQLEETLSWFYGLVPAETDLPVFIGELFHWARQTRLNIDRVTYRPAIDAEHGFLRYDLGFSLNGDYGQIKEFIHLLETSDRILLIERIAMSSASSNQQGSDLVGLRIDLGTFFRRDIL